ncbi:hypothetical protein [Streptomyces sp. NPDC086023]|uniref:hypothetical protein n=1 Tax=Streptomyces sp. NPDC086023 TaxID=3365746 RepID=UPI0037D11A09
MTVVGAVMVACNAAAYHAVALSADELAGQWRSREGTLLAFRADSTFTGEDVARLSAMKSCGGGVSQSSSGKWTFGSAGEAAESGAILSLTFPDTDCRVFVWLFGDVDDPVMCAPDGDPDAGCEYDEYLNRVAPAPPGTEPQFRQERR